MSKVALKKELEAFTKGQIIELLLDIYSSRTEMKQYLEFFLNPDSSKLYEKYRKLLDKEFVKARRGRIAKARISVIRKLIKDFASFHPDTKYMHMIYVQSISFGLYYDDRYYFSATLHNGIVKLAKEYLAYADKEGALDAGLKNIDELLLPGKPGGRYLRTDIMEACREYVESKSI